VVGGLLDRREQLAALVVRPLDVALAQAGDGRLDSRKGSAQVVTDGREQ
jgi:hypothetical protein